MSRDDGSALEGFGLGTPALVCRWRLAGGRLPLASRHLRALARRIVKGKPLSPELVAWAKQHIEQTLEAGSVRHPDGVLMLVIDVDGRAAMTVGPYRPLDARGPSDLIARAAASHLEAEASGVAPEVLWTAQGNELYWGIDRDFDTAGCASLVEDLAHTMGLRLRREPLLHEEVARGLLRADEMFLVSDEHGVVCADGLSCPHGTRLAQSYDDLLHKIRDGKR